jgi:hypothetical protein
MPQIQKSKTATSWAPKIVKNLLELDHTTKNTMQQQTLKNPLNIGHKNSNNPTVFKLSKNFMARKRLLKIDKQYLQITI